ncbi:MAG: carboxypeptidase-like regulatory domain-containing protein [Anaerolineae bacterium]
MIVRITSIVSPLALAIALIFSMLTLLLLLPTLPVAGAPAATGVITGRVYDSGGAPLAAANVWAEPMNGDPGSGDGTQADASGYYTITGLATNNYRVGAQKFGYATEYYTNTFDWAGATSVQVTDGNTTTGIDFLLDPGGVITGTVVDASSLTPITGAFVNAGPAGGSQWGIGTGQIDSTGAYTLSGLPVGQYKVDANAPGYEQEFYQDQTDWFLADVVTVTAGQVTPNINFTLQAEVGAAIYGQVVLPDGSPVPYAGIQAESFDYLIHKGEGADSNGNFRVGGLVTGTWRLRAHPPGGQGYANYSESDEILVPVNNFNAITLTAPITLNGVNVVGRAVMPDGSGVAWTGVDVYKTDYSIFKGTGTDQDGYFGLGGLPAGDYKAEVHVPWGTSGIVPPPPRSFTIVDPGVIVDLGNITFTQAAKHITGRVVRDGSGAGVPNVDVNASRRGADGWAWTQTDGSGNFSLDVSPGDWEVMINPGPNGTADWIYLGHPKMVSFSNDASQETVNVDFEVQSTDATVTGRVEGPNGEQLTPWSAWIDIRDNAGQGNGVPVAPDGSFNVPVVAGTYQVWIGVDEQAYPNWSGPPTLLFNIASGETKNLGTIRLVEKTSAIEGRVTRASDGAGMPGLMIHAWQFEGGWASTTTDSNGNYRLPVLAGTWEVDVEPPYTSTYVTGQPPQRVVVADNQTVPGIDFVLQEAAGIIEGTLYDPQGNLLTDINGGWAYARQGNAPEPIAGAPVDNGRFTLNVPPGTYMVGLWLPPNVGYTVSGEQQVGPLAVGEVVAKARNRAEVAVASMVKNELQASVQSGTPVPISFTLLPNDARIRGAFFLDDAKTVPATGLMGEVFAMSGLGGAWQSVPINPVDGSFELDVAAGTWNLGYWLQSTNVVNSPPPDTRVTVESGQEFVFNFTVVAADATIEGVIQKPDGSPLSHAWAWAHRPRSATSAAIDTGDDSKPPNGYFSINVPSGGQYEVGAFAPEDWGYIQPDIQVVTPTTNSPVNVTLRFKDSDGTITGTVYYHDEAGNRVYGPWAWVWAWSDDGQHAGAPTDQNGRYQLNVITGTTWHVGAVYQAEQGSLFYETIVPTDVVMNSAQASADLDLYLAATALPPAAAATFDPSVGWTRTLSDGTRIEIPAGAMPTTDTVRISITPLVEELHNTLTARPFGFGYAIAAYENTTGNLIASNFNANVLITFHYTEDDLRKHGVSEDDISPAYFSTTTNSWTKVESFNVDKVANRVTVQINHFSTWALTSSSSSGGGTNALYLPFMVK